MKKTRNTIAIVILSLISATGIGVYIYHRIKIKRLNEKVTNIDEIQQQIEDLDVTGEITPTDVDPNSQPNIEFDDNGNSPFFDHMRRLFPEEFENLEDPRVFDTDCLIGKLLKIQVIQID